MPLDSLSVFRLSGNAALTPKLVLALSLCSTSHANFVALSETAVWLSNNEPAAEVMMFASNQPLEYSVIADATDEKSPLLSVVRWVPTRILVPALTSAPLRFQFRPNSTFPAGDYELRLRISAKPLNFTPPFSKDLTPDEGQRQANETQAQVNIAPSLTIPVHIRHQVRNPALTVSFSTVTDTASATPSFSISKSQPDRAFIGYMKLVNKETGTPYTSNKLHISKATASKQVRYPNSTGLNDAVCLQVWETIEPKLSPDYVVCSE